MVVMEIGRRRTATVQRRVLPLRARPVFEGWFQNRTFISYYREYPTIQGVS